MKFMICGDFTATEKNEDLFRKGDVKKLFSDVTEEFDKADRIFVNIETVLTESGKKIKKWGPHLKTPPEAARLLKNLGFTDCGLSNNHIFDYGIEGAENTIRAIEEAGLNHTGFGKNEKDARKTQFIDTPEGKRIALIAVSDREYAYALEDRMGARVYDEYDTMLDIRDAKKESDRVIVIYHGGKEFSRYPSPRLRKSCIAMAEHGADVIICQHTHCIGCYEKYKDAHILYGQGNFHFVRDYPFDGWHTGLLVMLDIGEDINISFIPCVNGESGIRKADEKTAKELLSAMEKRNKELLTDEWKKGWKAVCEENRELYENAVKNVSKEDEDENYRQHFAHYLDCEAHCDIFRELFPTWNKTESF